MNHSKKVFQCFLSSILLLTLCLTVFALSAPAEAAGEDSFTLSSGQLFQQVVCDANTSDPDNILLPSGSTVVIVESRKQAAAANNAYGTAAADSIAGNNLTQAVSISSSIRVGSNNCQYLTLNSAVCSQVTWKIGHTVDLSSELTMNSFESTASPGSFLTLYADNNDSRLRVTAAYTNNGVPESGEKHSAAWQLKYNQDGTNDLYAVYHVVKKIKITWPVTYEKVTEEYWPRRYLRIEGSNSVFSVIDSDTGSDDKKGYSTSNLYIYQSLNIDPCSVTVTNVHKTYDGQASFLTVSEPAEGYTVKYSFDNETWYERSQIQTIKLNSMKNAGTYTVYVGLFYTANGDSVLTNSAAAAITVDPLPLTVTPNSGMSKEYGHDDPVMDGSCVTASGALGSQKPAFTGALSRASGEELGGYALNLGTLAPKQSGAFLPQNYYLVLDSTPVDFTITPAHMSVTTIENLGKHYGEEDPALDGSCVSCTGVRAGETAAFTGTLVRAEGENVGSYTVSQQDLALTDSGSFKAANYILQVNPGSFAVTPAALTVTPDGGKTKVYGADDPAFTYTYSGNLSGETPAFTGTLSRVSGEDAGSYNITLNDLALADNGDFLVSNYTIELSSTPIPFTVTPAALTVTPDSAQRKTYGDADPALSYHWSGVRFDETPVFSGVPTRAPGENAGQYPICLNNLTLIDGEGFLASNYTLSIAADTVLFTIDRRPLTIAANDRSVRAGSPAVYTAAADGPLPAGCTLTDLVTLSCSYDRTDPVIGSYDIIVTPKEGDFTLNYELLPENGTLTVLEYTPAAVALSSVSKAYLGEQTTLAVSLENGCDAFEGQLTLSYDPAVLGTPTVLPAALPEGSSLTAEVRDGGILVHWVLSEPAALTGSLFLLQTVPAAEAAETVITVSGLVCCDASGEDVPVQAVGQGSGFSVIPRIVTVELTLLTAERVSVTVREAPVCTAFLVFCDADGRLLCCDIRGLSEGENSFSWEASAALTGCSWRLFLIGSDHSPVYAALSGQTSPGLT